MTISTLVEAAMTQKIINVAEAKKHLSELLATWPMRGSRS